MSHLSCIAIFRTRILVPGFARPRLQSAADFLRHDLENQATLDSGSSKSSISILTLEIEFISQSLDSLRNADLASSPSRLGKSPGRDTTPGRKTPGGAADRFIPNRSATDYELSHFKIVRESLTENERY